MAILKGIEVSVIIGGNVLTEYDDEDILDESSDHTSEVSKYIEVVSDAEFGIRITAPRSYNFMGNALAFRLTLDGVTVRTYVYRKAELKNLRQDWQKTITGSQVKNGKDWCLRPFKFDAIKMGQTSTQILGSYINEEIQWSQLPRLAAGRATISPSSEPSHSMSLTKTLLENIPAPTPVLLDSVVHPKFRRRSSKVETSRIRPRMPTLVC